MSITFQRRRTCGGGLGRKNREGRRANEASQRKGGRSTEIREKEGEGVGRRAERRNPESESLCRVSIFRSHSSSPPLNTDASMKGRINKKTGKSQSLRCHPSPCPTYPGLLFHFDGRAAICSPEPSSELGYRVPQSPLCPTPRTREGSPVQTARSCPKGEREGREKPK